MTSDIFLREDRIHAVPTKDASFDVATGEDSSPDIQLVPNSASLVLGGGDGDSSDGDIRLMEGSDNGESKPRIHLTSGTGTTDSDTRVRIDGSDGTAKLGAESADDPDIELLPSKADVELGGGSGGSDSDGGLKLFDGDQKQRVFIESSGTAPGSGTQTENAVYLTAGASDDAGRLILGRVGDDFSDATVDLDGATAQLTLGSDVEPGSIHLVDSGDDTTVTVESERSNGGAGIELTTDAGDATADIDAGEREMELGGAGVGGTILLTDGEGTTFELTVQDGTIRLGSADNGDVAMELEPDEGLFKIVDGDDDTGFQVDTQRKTIKKGQKYTGGVVNRGS